MALSPYKRQLRMVLRVSIAHAKKNDFRLAYLNSNGKYRIKRAIE